MDEEHVGEEDNDVGENIRWYQTSAEANTVANTIVYTVANTVTNIKGNTTVNTTVNRIVNTEVTLQHWYRTSAVQERQEGSLTPHHPSRPLSPLRPFFWKLNFETLIFHLFQTRHTIFTLYKKLLALDHAKSLSYWHPKGEIFIRKWLRLYFHNSSCQTSWNYSSIRRETNSWKKIKSCIENTQQIQFF